MCIRDRDIEGALALFTIVDYEQNIKLSNKVQAILCDAGHILGSATIKLIEGSDSLVFSGDLGNNEIPILRDPSFINSADYLIIESTYGNRNHKEGENKVEKFVQIIDETRDKGGNIIIPSFAVGRTQEVIYELNKKLEKYNNRLIKLFNVPVFIDSPLAISAKAKTLGRPSTEPRITGPTQRSL